METGRKLAVLCLANRLTFAAVLLPWFAIGGVSKLAGLSLSLGPAIGLFPLSVGAFYAYLPGAIGQVANGPPEFSLLQQIYVAVMVGMELLLPVLVIIGWHTRLAATLLALHQTLALALAQPWQETVGGAFDASPFDMVPDQLLLWLMLLAPLALFGAGPLSVDAVRNRPAPARKQARGRAEATDQSTL